MRLLRSCALALVALVSSALLLPPAALAAPASRCAAGEVRAEADWVLSSQLPSGAFAQYPDLQRIDPYVGNYAALGLVAAATCVRDSRYVSAAYRHLGWYASVQDASGFVYDYELQDGVFVSTGDMDSTDGYAGVFLSAVQAYTKVDPSTSRLRALLPGVRGAVRAIRATQVEDGLTWAKPSWHVKYLIDQVEALSGLDAAVRIGSRLGDAALVAEAQDAASRLRAGIASLWVPETSSYVWAVHGNGERVPYTQGSFYPDDVSQVWGAAYGVEDPSRAAFLVSRMGSTHPSWYSPAAVVPGQVEYWPVVAWAFSSTGRSGEALEGARAMLQYALSTGRAWPYTPGTAGQLLVTLSGADARLWRS